MALLLARTHLDAGLGVTFSSMDALDGTHPDPQNTPDVLGAGPADSDPTPSADTLPSSSPPPTTDEDNFTVAPSSTISPEIHLDGAQDEKDPPTVHTRDLVRTDTDEMLLDTDAAGGQAEDGQDWMPDGQEQEMKRVKARTLAIQRVCVFSSNAGIRACGPAVGRPGHCVLLRPVPGGVGTGPSHRTLRTQLLRHHLIHTNTKYRCISAATRCVLVFH
jgi:hypothetical protein